MRERSDLRLSANLREIIEEAEDIAYEAGQPPSSGHLLLAMYTIRNCAEAFLQENGMTEKQLLDGNLSMDEPDRSVRAVMDAAAQIAASCESDQIEALHVIFGITRVRTCSAHRLLGQAIEKSQGPRMPKMRAMILGQLSVGPQWEDRTQSSDRSRRKQATDWKPPVLAGKPTARKRPSHSAATRRTTPESVVTVAEALPAKPERGPPKPGFIEEADGWLLPVEDFPWLSRLGRNLSYEAALGKIDALIGREKELDQLADVLGKRRGNNPCLIGEPGVGKTSIVEGLALHWVNSSNDDRIIIGLDAGRLLMGTHLRGSFSERIHGLKEEVERAEGKVLVFFDEIHTLIGAGQGGDGSMDVGQELKAALARGAFPCIGATTPEAYHGVLAKDAALCRRFVPIAVEEPSAIAAVQMLSQTLPNYAEHHGVGYQPAAVESAVKLSIRFLPEQRLPDKALALLDLAGSRCARAARQEVTLDDVAALVSERSGLDMKQLTSCDSTRLLRLEEELEARIVGRKKAIAKVSEVIRRNAAGFGSERPQGSFLLVGPSGVGKTETAKALAAVLHGDPRRLVRFDLSEFSEAHTAARLVGSPPGYVGYETGGQLTEAVRRQPACVLLFDEIEKAHADILQILLQVLDDGRLTDGHGRTITFSETIILLTTNLGSELVAEPKQPIGFAQPSQGVPKALEAKILQSARGSIAPELWGRIDEKIVYGPLEKEDVRQIARLLVARSSARLEKERGISFELDTPAVDAVIEHGGFQASLGARPLRQTISQMVEAPIASRVLEGRLRAGEHIRVGRHLNGGLIFRVRGEQIRISQRPAPA